MASQIFIFSRKQNKKPGDGYKDKHQQEVWDNSFDTPCIENPVTKSTLCQTSENNAGNQVTRYDEEYVNTEESSREEIGKRMEQQYRQNRNRPQPGNVVSPYM